MAQHDDLLELFRDANFGWVFIGIESPDPASLKETLKTQNLHEDMLTSLGASTPTASTCWPASSSASITTRWRLSSTSTTSSRTPGSSRR